jgi:hypothetical protein
MAANKARDPKLERRWRRHMRQQRAAGLTVRDYCAMHQLRESSFHFWRREIDRRDQEGQRLDPASSATPAPAFVPVTLVERPKNHDSVIDIRLPGGHRLRVRAGCERRLLEQVVAVLEGRPC